MTKLPLVSIITPSYNQAQYLEQTIRSVIAQSYPNIEYIIIDGGSTDGSQEIIQRYQQHLKYWISEKDNGQTHAVNKGVEKCEGEIIAYINSDDLYEKDAIRDIVNAYMENGNAAVYYGTCATIDEHGKIVKNYKGGPTSFHFLQTRSMLPYIYQPACFFNARLATRRPLFIEKTCIDYELLLHLSEQFPFRFIKKPVAQYRIHNETRTTLEQDQIFLDKLMIQLRYGAGMEVRWNLAKFRIKKLLGLTKKR
jgi:glycosyltransferase involved in cell wall biosynthesis